ncbi:MAG TPA: ribosome small subunit-dependent GTPase A [Spirochaetia bacterium]|nr:ribosome small subunit-dependent GTPase A [Spirochaetia bacterium]
MDSSTSIEGEVLFGISTIYTVQAGGTRLQCRIKGKKLKEPSRSYNPIAPGDRVQVIPDPRNPGAGMIASVLPRTTQLVRWNKKGRAPQMLAANADIAVCVTTSDAPPFRPRFIDRLIVAAEAGGLTPVVLLNKCDLPCPQEVAERLEHYGRMGYAVLRCSSRTGHGVSAFADRVRGRTAVLVGQSGVGKTSLLNALAPGLDLRVGELSQKHNRGNHTTNFSMLLQAPASLRIVDTPGVRELELAYVLPDEVGFHFREFTEHARSCAYQPCLHDDEPGCAVAAAVERGEIHPDRYESYLRILQELRETTPMWQREER